MSLVRLSANDGKSSAEFGMRNGLPASGSWRKRYSALRIPHSAVPFILNPRPFNPPGVDCSASPFDDKPIGEAPAQAPIGSDRNFT